MKPLLLLVIVFSFALRVSSAPIQPLAQKWTARYDGPLHQDDFSSVVAVDAAGDLYVAGYTTDAQRNADACVIKYAGATGERLWEWHANLPSYIGDVSQGVMPMILRLTIGPDGNPVAITQTGLSYSGGGWQVLKFRASDGTVIWGGQQPAAATVYALALDANGDVFVGGAANGRGMTVKYAATSGAMLWQRPFGQTAGYSTVAIRALQVDASGDVVATGYDHVGGRYQAYTGKYAGSDGAVRWEQRISNSAADIRGRELALDASGSAIVAMDNGLLCKYAGTNGAQSWQRQGTATPYEMLVDAAGDIYVASSVYTTDFAHGATLAKYAGSDGFQRWTNSYSAEFFCSLLLRNGEILVAGQRSGNSDDVLLSAFDPTTGARRWDVTYGTPNLQDRMSSTYRSRGRIALQPDGGVVITGCSQGTGTGYDFATLQYSPGPGLKSPGIASIFQTGVLLFTKAVDNGASATLAWQYGPTTTYGSTTLPLPIIPTSTQYPYNSRLDLTSPSYTTIGGLAENTTFHARAIATSGAGITYGEDLVFTTRWDANGDHLPDDWEFAKWGNTSVRSATGDEDRDGLGNLLEYALAQNPRVSDSAGAIPIAAVGDHLTATITKQPFVTFTVEASSDLQTWSTADTTILLDDATTLIVRDNFAISDSVPRFLRVRVTAQ